LKAEHIRDCTMKTLTNHITLEANGYCCTPEMIFDVILKASAERSSIEAACDDLDDVADSNTIRDYLNTAFDSDQLREQEAEINTALADSIPVSMKREDLEIAIDFHDEPFYGKHPDLLAVTCKGRAKAGTTHFVRLATCYVIWRQVRLTLAVRYVLPSDGKLEIVQFLLRRLKTLGFTFKVLYMGKGFACGEVIDYLTEQRQPAIIACPIRGKQGGTRALGKGRKSYRADYTFTDGTHANLAMAATLVPDQTGKRRRKWLAFIVIELIGRLTKSMIPIVVALVLSVVIACCGAFAPAPRRAIPLFASSCWGLVWCWSMSGFSCAGSLLACWPAARAGLTQNVCAFIVSLVYSFVPLRLSMAR
jgi:hypothetical protein